MNMNHVSEAVHNLSDEQKIFIWNNICSHENKIYHMKNIESNESRTLEDILEEDNRRNLDPNAKYYGYKNDWAEIVSFDSLYDKNSNYDEDYAVDYIIRHRTDFRIPELKDAIASFFDSAEWDKTGRSIQFVDDKNHAVSSTGKDYDFIGVIENKKDCPLRVYFKDTDNLPDHIDIEPKDHIGILANDLGYDMMRAFINGEYCYEKINSRKSINDMKAIAKAGRTAENTGNGNSNVGMTL